MIEDLRDRTGLDIVKIQVGKIDFLRDTATVTIFYKDDLKEVEWERNTLRNE